MANRAHAKQTIPCKTPGCGGLMICRSSRLIVHVNGMARRRMRRCELCERTIQTLEYETRVLQAGARGYLSKLGQ